MEDQLMCSICVGVLALLNQLAKVLRAVLRLIPQLQEQGSCEKVFLSYTFFFPVNTAV